MSPHPVTVPKTHGKRRLARLGISTIGPKLKVTHAPANRRPVPVEHFLRSTRLKVAHESANRRPVPVKNFCDRPEAEGRPRAGQSQTCPG